MASGTWKLLSVTLQQAAQWLPPPANTAVGLMATVASLTTMVLEAKGVSKENQKLVEQLSERSLMVSRIIETYVAESRPQNDIFTAFVSRFRATMDDVLGFVEKFLQQGWVKRLVNSDDVKSQFGDLWRRLDALAADYRGYLLQKMVTKGPSERIEHPQLREFWRQSMTNALEAKWLHFWDQLQHDFPGTRQFLSGPSALSNKAKLQATAIPHDVNFVGPWEVNNLFHPPQCSVEHIISNVLAGDGRAVDVAGYQGAVEHLASGHQNSKKVSRTKATEVQCWTGYWTQGSHRGVMNVELFFATNHKIAGGGSDEVGLFTCTGECQGTRVYFIKQYIGKHEVKYDGEIRNKVISGTWTIEKHSHGNFSGNFHLEMQSRKFVAKTAEAGLLKVGVMQHWTGYYIQGHTKGNMNADILFTNTHNIYGTGVDDVGRFTWLGRFEQGSHSASVKMTKQYNKSHAVHYMGAIGHSLSMGEEELEVVMEGSWALSDSSDHGTFVLQPERQKLPNSKKYSRDVVTTWLTHSSAQFT